MKNSGIMIAVAVLAVVSVGSSAMAATAAKPAMKKAAAAPAVASTLYCKLSTSGSNVTVQVVNSGKKDAAKGTVFDFIMIGPHHKTPGSYTLPWALGPKQWLNVTKPMPAAGVTSCAPAAA
jgi:hypothetical protein